MYAMEMFNTQWTDGVQFLRGKTGDWLLTDILSILGYEKKVRAEEFVAIKISIKEGKAVFKYEDGNDNVLYTQKYAYTDAPDLEQTLFCTNNVLMLAGEY